MNDKIRLLIREEIHRIMQEDNINRYGQLADPNTDDPIDPEINVKGFGSFTRTALRQGITARLKTAYETAKKAETGGAMTNTFYRNLRNMMGDMGVLYTMISAELDVAEELESKRKRGGRRSIPIPKQY
jgi:hypothetical protein